MRIKRKHDADAEWISVQGIGLMQAMFEFCCMTPKQRKGDMSEYEYDTLLQLFEAFWDSEAPRVGETVLALAFPKRNRTID